MLARSTTCDNMGNNTNLESLVEERYSTEWVLLEIEYFLEGINLDTESLTLWEQRPRQNPTLVQHPAISSTSDSILVHSAAANWGAVMFVGSVRTRDLYSNPCDACGGSGIMPCLERNEISTRANPPLATISFDIRDRSKAFRIRSSTASLRSRTRPSTSVGSVRRL